MINVGSYDRIVDPVLSFHYYLRLDCSCLLSGGPRESLTLLVLSAPKAYRELVLLFSPSSSWHL